MHESPARPIHAVVDVGSKSIRLLVARELSPEAFEVVDEERFDSRLGEGQRDGQLTPEAIERGIHALRVVTQVARSYQPGGIVAVGTEALRSAPNAAIFLERARAETGVDVRILDAGEEAFASYLGVVNSTLVDDGFIVDIGGGSLELIEVADRDLWRSSSVPLGSIYATERYFRSDPPSPKEVRALRRAVAVLVPARTSSPALYGVGGAIRNIARMARVRARYPVTRLHGYVLTRADLRRVTRALVSTPAAERRRLPGINADRVATLPAAAVVIEEVMDRLKAGALVVSGQGLREGLVWQQLRGDAVLEDVRAASVAGLAIANGVDIAGAEPEVAVASALFDATAEIHGLGPADRDLLLQGARLAEIGMHVDFYSRDRHAEYLVHSGDLRGFTHREIVVLAAMLRWSASGTPDLSPFRAIAEPGDDRRVQVLGVFIGVARAVWRRTPSPVRSFEAAFKGGTLRLRLVAEDAVDAEATALERQTRRLEAALRVPVQWRLDVPG